MHGRTLFAPTTRLKPPLCKGRWHGVSRDGGIVILRGQVDFLARSQSPTAYRRSPLYTRGPFLYTHKSASTQAGPLCRCATSPHTVGSHPSSGACRRTVDASIARPQESYATAKLPGRIWNPPLRFARKFAIIARLPGASALGGAHERRQAGAPEVAGLFCFSFGHKREGLP